MTSLRDANQKLPTMHGSRKETDATPVQRPGLQKVGANGLTRGEVAKTAKGGTITVTHN